AGIAPQLEKFETSLGNVQRLAERAASPDPTAQILARQVKLKDLIPRTASAIDNLVKIDTVFREGVTSQNDPPDRPGQTKGNTIRSYRLTWYKPIEALALLAKQVDGRSFDQAVSETDMHAKVPGEDAFGD
ncbi:hypothetical protein, partial [Micrococcus sp. M4NT]|uniref:hypothetical protein n=1 Tax=Micrococcus sp. M4NT TaxID=2957501 RepID=UPI0029C0684C